MQTILRVDDERRGSVSKRQLDHRTHAFAPILSKYIRNFVIIITIIIIIISFEPRASKHHVQRRNDALKSIQVDDVRFVPFFVYRSRYTQMNDQKQQQQPIDAIHENIVSFMVGSVASLVYFSDAVVFANACLELIPFDDQQLLA